MRARENPFRSECMERLYYRNDGFSWQRLEEALASAGGRGAIVGPEGHGKTTLLAEWYARRAGEGVLWIRFRRGQRRVDQEQKCEIAHARYVFADSAEQLGFFGWREFLRLTRSAREVVVATHRSGRFRTIHVCKTSPSLLSELLTELNVESAEAEAMQRRHRGNLRAVFRELYDLRAVGSVASSLGAGR